MITKAIRLYGQDEFPATLGLAKELGMPHSSLAALSIASSRRPPIVWHFAALRRLAHERFGPHPFILDCGDCGGSVLEAWESGIEGVVFSGEAVDVLKKRARGKLLFRPAELPPIFDVAETNPKELKQALGEWLKKN